MKLKQNKLKPMRTAAVSSMVAPLIALAFLAMSGSVTSALATIPVASNIDVNTANWSTSDG